MRQKGANTGIRTRLHVNEKLAPKQTKFQKKRRSNQNRVDRRLTEDEEEELEGQRKVAL